MTKVINIHTLNWNQQYSTAVQEHALHALEEGNVLLFPQLSFALKETETQFLSPATLAKSKNVSLDIATGKLRGSNLGQAEAKQLQALMQHFADCSTNLIRSLLPHYQESLIQARTSFRPVEIVGRGRRHGEKTIRDSMSTAFHLHLSRTDESSGCSVILTLRDGVVLGGSVNHLKASLANI